MFSYSLVLGEDASRSMFSAHGTVLLLVYAFFVVLIIVAVVMFLRFLAGGIKEMKLIRMELGKVAEEVHLLRQELKGEQRTILQSSQDDIVVLGER